MVGEETRLYDMPQASEGEEMKCQKCNGPTYKSIIGLNPTVSATYCRGCKEIATGSRCTCKVT